LGTCAPTGIFAYLKVYILRLAIEGKSIFIHYLFPNIHISVNAVFKFVKCLLLNISIIRHDKIFGEKSNYAIESNFRRTCSSVEMLKGYMVRGRFGNPCFKEYTVWSFVCS